MSTELAEKERQLALKEQQLGANPPELEAVRAAEQRAILAGTDFSKELAAQSRRRREQHPGKVAALGRIVLEGARPIRREEGKEVAELRELVTVLENLPDDGDPEGAIRRRNQLLTWIEAGRDTKENVQLMNESFEYLLGLITLRVLGWLGSPGSTYRDELIKRGIPVTNATHFTSSLPVSGGDIPNLQQKKVALLRNIPVLPVEGATP